MPSVFSSRAEQSVFDIPLNLTLFLDVVHKLWDSGSPSSPAGRDPRNQRYRTFINQLGRRRYAMLLRAEFAPVTYPRGEERGGAGQGLIFSNQSDSSRSEENEKDLGKGEWEGEGGGERGRGVA